LDLHCAQPSDEQAKLFHARQKSLLVRGHLQVGWYQPQPIQATTFREKANFVNAIFTEIAIFGYGKKRSHNSNNSAGINYNAVMLSFLLN
jgi:hypothetical protein